MDLVTIIASFLSGLLCSMGFGGGSVLIIFLTSYLSVEQKAAQGINLFFFIPIALYSVLKYNKQGLIEKSILKPYISGGIIGVAIGYGVITFLPTEYLTKGFGILLIVMGIKDLFCKDKK